RFGVFCRGIEVPVEGLLHMTALDAATGEIFDFDEGAHALVARTSGWTLQLGRPLRVKIARVDIEARKLEFAPSEEIAKNLAPRLGSHRQNRFGRKGRDDRRGRNARSKSRRPP